MPVDSPSESLLDSSVPVAFKAHLLPHIVDDKSVLLLSESAGKFLLRGKLYATIAPLLNGTRTVDEIVHALREVAAPEMVYFALLTLEQKGYIASRCEEGLSHSQAAFWHGLGA